MNGIICLIFVSIWMQMTTAQILAPGLKNQETSNLVYLNSFNNADIADTTNANIASTASNLNNLIANSIARDANIQAANLQAANQGAKIQAVNNEASNINKASFVTGISNANNVAAQNRYANTGIVNNYANTNGLLNSNFGGYSFRNNAYSGVSVNGQSGPQAFGISVVADGLEVGGQLAVNGRLPFYSAVAVNSRIPNDGSAIVDYSCGGPVGR